MGLIEEGGYYGSISFPICKPQGFCGHINLGSNGQYRQCGVLLSQPCLCERWYRGTIYIDLAQAVPTGTTGTLPVLFETNGVTQAVTKYNGEALTAADIPGTGVFEFWFDRTTNTLQIMTGVV